MAFPVEVICRMGLRTACPHLYRLLYGDQARFFEDEIRPHLKHKRKGVVAMASAGENLNASQFYITTAEDMDSLDEKHTIFGQVGSGIRQAAEYYAVLKMKCR